jgi:LysR family hydrogen peroxide-inducible transcriptional activator
MTITQLQYLLAVAEYQNYTLAAQKSFVTQPTLSMQINKLEDELGIQIFDRSKKPVQLTEIGQSIVNQARKIVDESNRMKDVVEQFKGVVGGDFKIGIIPTIMPTLLPMFLTTFTKKYPKIKLIIEELHTDVILEKLKLGQLDCALAATPLNDNKIKEEVLYYEPFMAYLPNRKINKNEIDINDLDEENILLLQEGHCFKNNIINFCKINNSSNQHNFVLESGSFETLINLCEEGIGITFVPYLHTLQMAEKSQKNLVHFTDPKPAREISLIYTKTELKKHIIDALSNTLRQVIRGAIQFQNVEITSPLKKTH